MSIASAVFGALGRRSKAPAPRKLDPSEKRYQATRPFEAIRQELMAQGVAATPELMQSYQDQAASEKAKPSGGPVGKRSSVGGFDAMSGSARDSMLKKWGVTDPTQRLNLMSGGANRNRTLAMGAGPMGRGFAIASMGKRTGPPPAPEMPGGSFYQQTLSRKPGAAGGLLGALSNNSALLSRLPTGGGLGGPMGHRSTYQWNRTAREGTKSYQSPF